MKKRHPVWYQASNVVSYPEEAMEILSAFNNIVNGLYKLTDDYNYMFEVFNTQGDVQKEIVKLLNDVDNESLANVAVKFEMARNLLLGDAFDWDYMLKELKERTENQEKIQS